jgi:hypothetical protein
MNSFFKNTIHEYKKVFTDLGTEYTSKIIQDFFKSKKLKWYTVENREIKVGVVERVIRTIKSRIGKVITHFNDEKYIHLIPRIVETYNNTNHRGLKWKTPLEVHLMSDSREIVKFSMMIYKIGVKGKKSLTNLLPVGQVVRLVSSRITQGKFVKSFYIQNTEELFKISKVNINHKPITYTVTDLEGDLIKGSFYREELTIASDSGLYDIEVLKSKIVRGKKEYFIKYVNYPNSKPLWVKASILTRKS